MNAYELGIKAFKNGVNCFAHDAEACKMLGAVGQNDEVLTMWNAGFENAKEEQMKNDFPEFYA